MKFKKILKSQLKFLQKKEYTSSKFLASSFTITIFYFLIKNVRIFVLHCLKKLLRAIFKRTLFENYLHLKHFF